MGLLDRVKQNQTGVPAPAAPTTNGPVATAPYAAATAIPVARTSAPVEKSGGPACSAVRFECERQMGEVIDRIVSLGGRRVDESTPICDARLKDGSRVNVVIPPIALKGPCLTIRKFAKEKWGPADVVNRFRSSSPELMTFLRSCVRARFNILVSGGTGSGKTTLLNILSSFIPETERLITCDDAAELQLQQPHWIQLESLPPNVEGKGAVPILELVKSCLRMRPDRIIP